MDLDKMYAGHVRKHLGLFPVWPPGDEVSPGNVGRLENGIFYREGTLSDLLGPVSIDVKEQPTRSPTRFRSDDCSATTAQVSGGGQVAAGVSGQAEMTLHFAQAGGAAFDAEDCQEHTIGNLLELREQIEADRGRWRDELVLVTRATVAGSYMVILSGQAGASVGITGSADALGQWNIARAGLSSTSGNKGGYQRSGSGPILLGLYGFNWWSKVTQSGSMKPLSLSGPSPDAHEFIEVPARNRAFD